MTGGVNVGAADPRRQHADQHLAGSGGWAWPLLDRERGAPQHKCLHVVETSPWYCSLNRAVSLVLRSGHVVVKEPRRTSRVARGETVARRSTPPAGAHGPGWELRRHVREAVEPITVGGVTIKNRIVRSPHGTGLYGDEFIAYHVARAKGGVGMSTVSATSVHPNAPGAIRLWDDGCKPYLEKLGNAVHEHGMKMFHQIYHPGASQGEMVGGAEAWSASEIPNFLGGAVVPVAISKGQIDDLVEHFAGAARRIRDAGLDGVDIHASSGYLLHEFLSPALNQRDDEYGGTPEKRMRLLLEVIDAVRSEVGDSDFAVGVRLPNEDYVPGGLTADQNRHIAETVDPLVDYVSLHMGSYWRFHKLIAPSDDPLGVEMAPNATIRPVITKPTSSSAAS